MHASRIMLASLLAWPLRLNAEAAGAFPYRSAAEIHNLPREAAYLRKPVSLRGIVTYRYPPEYHAGFTLADSSGTVYVRVKKNATNLVIRAGDEIELVGETWPGNYAMSVTATNAFLLGRNRPLPPPVSAEAIHLLDGRYDCACVRLRGIVMDIRTDSAFGERQVLVKTPTGTVLAFLSPATPLDKLTPLQDCGVEVTGICFPVFNMHSEMVGARLACRSPADFKMVHAAVPPFEAPAADPACLLPFSPAGNALGRRRLSGVVSAIASPNSFFCQIATNRGIRVQTDSPDLPTVGAAVELSGFLTQRNLLTELEHTRFRVTGIGALPEPIVLTRKEAFENPRGIWALHPDYHGRIVSIIGTLQHIGFATRGTKWLSLNLEGYLVFARAPDETKLEDLKLGSTVRLTGVCAVTFEETYPAIDVLHVKSFQLLVRVTDDIRVLREPPWWTPARLFLVIGSLTLVILFIVLRNLRLRHLIEKRTRELLAQEQAGLEMKSRLDERTRLAADLHDTLEQELTGTSLQLEAASLLRAKNAEKSSRCLEAARKLLARTREDLHRTVWGLRDHLLREGRFAEALREKLTTATDEIPVLDFADQTSGTTLSEMQAYHLYQATMEALTNARKHAAATRITLTLSRTPATFSVCIADNGKGFDPARTPGPAEGHFGLQGMRERLARMQGTCEIISRPGETRLTLTIPFTEKKQ